MPLQKSISQLNAYLIRRPDFRKILTNTAWLFSDSILRLIFTIIIGAWIARYLGTEQYGQLNLALAYLTLATPILRLGLDQVLVRRLVDNPQESDVILSIAFLMRLISALLLAVPITLIVNQLHLSEPMVVTLVALFAFATLFQALDVIVFWFQAEVDSRNTVLARNISFIFISLIKVIAILAQAPLIVFGMLYVIDTILYMFLLLYIYWRRRSPKLQSIYINWSLIFNYARSLLAESAPLILAGLAISVYMRIDQIMLGQMMPKEIAEQSVGIYAAAVKISEIWYFIPTAIVNSVFPVLIQSKKQSYSLYKKRLQRLFNLMTLISYSIAVFITLLSSFIINTIYGAVYAESAPVLTILAWAGIWVSLGITRTAILHAENLTIVSMWATFAGAIANIILNVLLIPTMGILGCAIATLLSQIVAAQVTTFIFPQIRSYGWMQLKALLYPNPLANRKLQ